MSKSVASRLLAPGHLVVGANVDVSFGVMGEVVSRQRAIVPLRPIPDRYVRILGIVWQSGRAAFTRMLDGIDPGILSNIRHTAEHVAAVDCVVDAKA
jgi:hypothetical protein